MTEAEWRAADDPRPMLRSLRDRGGVSERKLRLLAAACCRLFGHAIIDERFFQTVEVVERYADNRATKAALKRARQTIRAARHGLSPGEGVRAEWGAYWLAELAASEKAYPGAADEVRRLGCLGICGSGAEWHSSGAALLRDLFGPLPFRPVTVSAACLTWNEGTVRRLAEAIYAERAFERMPILADALEEAGCDNADILAHCREQAGVHARGCWVLDLLLQKG